MHGLPSSLSHLLVIVVSYACQGLIFSFLGGGGLLSVSPSARDQLEVPGI